VRPSDAQLYEQVLRALEAEMDVGYHEIGIAVSSGVVILSGSLESEDQARTIERIATHVPGVAAVMQTARVGTAGRQSYLDTAIAHQVVKHLAQRLGSLENRLVARVEHGWVTLEGEVDLAHERTDAEETICGLPGVRGVSNHLTVRPPETVARIRAKIDAVLNRIARPTALATASSGNARDVPVAHESAAVGEQPDPPRCHRKGD
jgi:osmotically-inducible protein OsmY